MRRWISLIALLCVAGLATPALAQPSSVERIFVSEDQVPGKPAGVLFGFCPNSNHALNDRGEVAFIWCFGSGGNSDGVFLRSPAGAITIVAETGQDTPGVTGGVFAGSFDRLVFNDAGDLMFTGLLEIGPGGVTADDNLGIWYYHDGVLDLVGREGTQAPGAATGELFTGTPQPLLGRRSGAGFNWAARDPGGPLAAPPGLWSVDASGTVDLVVRQGDPAPGFAPGDTIGVFNGRRVIDATHYVYGAGVTPVPGLSAIWVEDDTTIEIRAAGGNPVPGTGGLVSYSSPEGGKAVNFSREIAFRTGLNNSPFGSTGLVGPDGAGDLGLVAIEGEPAPGAGGAGFGSLATIPYVLNGRGEVAFLASLQGGGNGLWTNAGGTLHEIALQGDPAAGFPGDDFDSFFQFSANGLHLTDARELLFYGNVNLKLHLFHAAPDGTVSLLFENGQTFEVRPGEFRTVTGIGVQEGQDDHDRPRRSFNSAGQLLVRLRFDNSTRGGLWLSDLPSIVSDPISYAALGDSYSSGEGAPPYFAGTDTSDNECHRSTRAYATALRTPGNDRSLFELTLTEPAFEWDFLACSGAVAENVRSDGEGIFNEPPQLDPVNNVDASRDLVTISIGGNDAQFANIIKFCLVHDACHEFEPFEPLTQLTVEDLFPILAGIAKQNARDVHAEIRTATPNAPTVVIGYPQVLGGRECPAVIFPLWPQARLSAAEQVFLRDATSQLNARIGEAAAEVGVHFIPAAAHFAGHGVCGTRADWLHGILLFPHVSSFHPKVRGQVEFARLINDYFETKKTQGWPPGYFTTGLPRNPDPQPAPPPGSIDGTTPTLGTLEVAADPPAACETDDVYVPGQTVRLTGDGFGASENATVRLRVAGPSAPVAVGSLAADAGGKIDGIVTMPMGITTPALATLEVFGAGVSGVGHLLVELVRIEDSFSSDGDNDGVPDLCDNCPAFPSADQTDNDGDGVGDACDVCPGEFDDDADGDGLCAGIDLCPVDVENDADADGLCASEDNCALHFNPAQVDSDGDGRGDLCDDEPCHTVDLTVRSAAGGQVVFEPSNCGLDTYYEDTPLAFEAFPDDAGFHFTGWTGDVSSTTNPLPLTVDGSLQLTANFCTDPTDTDGDLVGDTCDNCPGELNADQVDGDGDSAGDPCDCAPADSGVFAAPVEIADLTVLADGETLVWASLSATAGSATVYDVIRGDLASLPVGTAAETCVAPGTSSASAQDGATPATGGGFYYVVRAVNSCGTGTFGFASGGSERITTTCP